MSLGLVFRFRCLMVDSDTVPTGGTKFDLSISRAVGNFWDGVWLCTRQFLCVSLILCGVYQSMVCVE